MCRADATRCRKRITSDGRLHVKYNSPSCAEEARSDIDVSTSYSTYIEYNKVLRAWFVAFGVGGPAVFLVNTAIAERLAIVGELRQIVVLFLIGVGVQVVGALINNISNWYVYQAYTDSTIRKSWLHAVSEWLVNQFWIDVSIDLATIVTFGIAAWKLLMVFSPTPV